MIEHDLVFKGPLSADVTFGFLDRSAPSAQDHHPEVVVNTEDRSVLRILREELARSDEFLFSVAFVTPNALAMLKQELVEFSGKGTIVTSDYLAFNSPEAFRELLNLERLGIEVRLHSAKAFHPKGYVFKNANIVTAMIGSSNLTAGAIVSNHEWNLKVSASVDSDLSGQIDHLIQRQIEDSVPLRSDWVDEYARRYSPMIRSHVARLDPDESVSGDAEVSLDSGKTQMPIMPNLMQVDALKAIAAVRGEGAERAVVVSATGTGKTILSALEVRAANPERFLFIVHREQILDKTMSEYRRVIGGAPEQFGKLAGTYKQVERRFVFATVQTLQQDSVLSTITPGSFDYVIVDEAHRVGARSYAKVLEHLQPKFLLGLTATPERSDGFNVFEFFDYNVPYEIRLGQALESDMLSPFHYYGIADVETGEGRLGLDDDLRGLISAERVTHIVRAIETYGQAGVPAKGLIFCSRNDEARALSIALNKESLRDRPLRTQALQGSDSIEHREHVIAMLERGELDYILTVDIFNEGVDIPSVNQVIMLRQTQSAIVFVQQLGRGLRKHADKDYLVVIDFIGNYANNYLIPIALFGDESLNKEILKEKMISVEQRGTFAGLSSIRFDKIAQQRVLESIRSTALDSIMQLRASIKSMSNRVGGVPRLMDFHRFESVDPVLLATKKNNYPTLVRALLKEGPAFEGPLDDLLSLISNEIMTAKRLHEFILLETLLSQGSLSRQAIRDLFSAHGLSSSDRIVDSAIESLTLANHAQADIKKYGTELAEFHPEGVTVNADLQESYGRNKQFALEVDDIIDTGKAIVALRYSDGKPFILGAQYSRKEVTRLLGLPRKWTSTLYGYKVDRASGTCPIFVTLHKSEEISESTAYQDALLNPSTLRWFTRSRRTFASDEVQAIITNSVDLHVFVKKDDAEGSEFFYLGKSTAANPQQDVMQGKDGAVLDVVHMDLRFEKPIDTALYDYLKPNELLH